MPLLCHCRADDGTPHFHRRRHVPFRAAVGPSTACYFFTTVNMPLINRSRVDGGVPSVFLSQQAAEKPMVVQRRYATKIPLPLYLPTAAGGPPVRCYLGLKGILVTFGHFNNYKFHTTQLTSLR